LAEGVTEGAGKVREFVCGHRRSIIFDTIRMSSNIIDANREGSEWQR
jgi:hypothetical protein